MEVLTALVTVNACGGIGMTAVAAGFLIKALFRLRVR